MPIGSGFASMHLEKCSFCAGRDGRLRSESHHSEGQWEAAFVAMLLGSCSSQLAEEERSYWIELAVPSVGVRGRRDGGGTGEFGAKPAGAWSPGELCAHVRQGEGALGASPWRVR